MRFPRTATATLTAVALTLGGCGSKSAPADAGSNVDMSAVTDDNMVVPPSENGMAADGSGMAAASPQDFAMKAAMSDMYEIASSKLALTSAKDAGVKTFARSMIDAHTRTTAGLKAALAKDNVTMTPPATLDAEHQALIDALKGAKGAEFDTLYTTQQTDAHTKTLALMQGYAGSGTSPAIKAFAADTAPKVQEHLTMVKGMRPAA